ncbi:hypothetical protein [Paractinoplanes toevensis]|uniref:Uncharacterized protein n=1 Tax=Paractinoplanes toevensis TaxID=571911 RepID=A0A919WDD3_9ACTN|nr:hypothetical protein [Actinoplanes toevensis]GIM98072.1 hypothetical protein Ato02nite_098650 [Actinoplanes toevensis]
MTDFGDQRIIDRLLAHIEKNGDDERLREMATDVRRGDAQLRDFLSASEYSAALQPGLQGFTNWYERLDESERAAQFSAYEQARDRLNNAEDTSAETEDS